MKKLFVLLLALVVVMTFAACGSQENIRGEQRVEGSSSTEDVSGSESEDKVNSDEKFSFGDVKGLTYENKFIGLGCTLGSEWTFYTDEQIKELNNIALDAAGEEIEESIKNSDIIYDMYVERNGGIDNINVNLEKANPAQLALIDLEDYYLNAASTLVSSYENMGFTNITYKTGSVNIGGKAFECLNVVSEIQGIKMYQSVITIKCSGYLANVTFTTTGEDAIAELANMFYLTK